MDIALNEIIFVWHRGENALIFPKGSPHRVDIGAKICILKEISSWPSAGRMLSFFTRSSPQRVDIDSRENFFCPASLSPNVWPKPTGCLGPIETS